MEKPSVCEILSGEVLESIRRNLGLERGDDSLDSEIEVMPSSELFERFMNWNSIIGYEDTILNAVREIEDAAKIHGKEGLL